MAGAAGEERRQRVNSSNVAPIRKIYERWVGRFEELWANHLLRIKEDAEAKTTGTHMPAAQTKKRPKAGNRGTQDRLRIGQDSSGRSPVSAFA